jgi:hypothetical protein
LIRRHIPWWEMAWVTAVVVVIFLLTK